MANHFEDVWEKGEGLHKHENNSISDILNKLSLQIELYKLIDAQQTSNEEKEKAKSRTMGEILLTLTNLSLKDNINVFEALSIACQFKSIENSNKIPQDFKLPGLLLKF